VHTTRVAKLWRRRRSDGLSAALECGACFAIPYALLIAGGLAFRGTAVRRDGEPRWVGLLRAGIGRLPEETTPSPSMRWGAGVE